MYLADEERIGTVLEEQTKAALEFARHWPAGLRSAESLGTAPCVCVRVFACRPGSMPRISSR